MMKLSGALYVVMVVLSLVWAAHSQAVPSFDCGDSNLNSRIPKFTNLAVFPNPARVGQEVHIRAVVQLYSGIRLGDIKDGSMSLELRFNDAQFANIANIPLCNSSSSIVCSSLGPGDNAISFDYLVPKIPAGKYTIMLRISPNKTAVALNDGCVWFDIEIQDPDANPDKFVSWIEAKLAGDTHFENDDYMQRSIGEMIQVGPVGPVSPIVAYTFTWGRFIEIQGSGDLVQPYFNPGGYVWGLNGQMEELTYHGTTRDQLYNGDFYVGYVTSYNNRNLDVEILTGRFYLNWHIEQNNGVITSVLTGNITFDSLAELPMGFSNPITIGRLGVLQITTDSEGILTASGTATTCLEDADCNVVPGNSKDSSDDKIRGRTIGLIVGVVGGVALLLIAIVLLVKARRNSKRHREEDGIFSVGRKPEYGNALVVDDIIQETREHSPKMVPPLNRRNGDYSDDDSEYSRSRPRSRSRTPDSYTDRSRTPSRSRSRSFSDSDSDYTAGSSASRH